MTTNNRVINSVRGWFSYGFCPMSAIVADWGCEGCKRPVVLVTFGGRGDETLFHDEFETRAAAAERSARAVNGTITREWSRLNKAA